MTAFPTFVVALCIFLPAFSSSDEANCTQEATNLFSKCLGMWDVGMTTSQKVKAECRQSGGETATTCYPKLLSTIAPCSDKQKMKSAKIIVSATKAATTAYLCSDTVKYMKEVITDRTCWAAMNGCIQVFITGTSYVYGRSHCKNLRETIDGCKVTIRRFVNCTENVYPIVNRYFKYFLANTPCGYPSLHDRASSLRSEWMSWTIWLPIFLRVF